jgi:hypothetical protein
MKLQALYKSYFQKSKIFLYPLLKIKRGAVAVPEQTYLVYEDIIKPEHRILLCKYKDRTDAEYLEFEKERLFGHPAFKGYFKLKDGAKLFMFDFAFIGDDWDHLLNGRYSQISLENRKTIVNHFDKKTQVYYFIESYLFPKKYISEYARLLHVEPELLEEVGELCDKPDILKERLAV